MKFYWYPKCSTCQKAKQYLDSLNLNYELIDIVTNNPNKEDILKIYELSQLPIDKLFNTSGLVYKDLGLKNKMNDLSLNEKIALLSTNGKLIKRPILVLDDTAFFGFKQADWEKVLLKK